MLQPEDRDLHVALLHELLEGNLPPERLSPSLHG